MALQILGIAALGQLLFAPAAQAYLDPGTGSLIFQTVVAVIVGAGAALRIYWREVKAFFTRSRQGPKPLEARPMESEDGGNEPNDRP